MDNSRKYNIILITLFAVIIAGVPLTQIWIEIELFWKGMWQVPLIRPQGAGSIPVVPTEWTSVTKRNRK